MRALITGMGGFVAHHLAEELLAHGHEPWGTDVHAGQRKALATHSILRADLRRLDELKAAFEVAQPDVVFHLGAQSNPSRSWEIPRDTLEINVTGTRHVVQCAASLPKPARVILASSADVYGRPPSTAMPLREDQPPAPENPYAVTKLAAEHLARVYGQRLGVPVVVVRPFTQVGPGQLMQFAASYFAHEVARIEAGLGDLLRHGDLDAARDFTDVRDAARAYRLLAENDAAEGTFNLCSGRSRLVGDLLEMLLGMATVPVACELDPARQRSEHCHEFRGDATRLHEATGWTPRIPLEQTLRDLLEEHREYFRLRAAAEQPAE